MHVVVYCTYTYAPVVCMSQANSSCCKWILLDGIMHGNGEIKNSQLNATLTGYCDPKNNWCTVLQRCTDLAAHTYLFNQFEALVSFANNHGLAFVRCIDLLSNFVALQNMISLTPRRKQPGCFPVPTASNIAGRQLLDRSWGRCCSNRKKCWCCVCSRVIAPNAEHAWSFTWREMSRGDAVTCIHGVASNTPWSA